MGLHCFKLGSVIASVPVPLLLIFVKKYTCFKSMHLYKLLLEVLRTERIRGMVELTTPLSSLFQL
jgi:hypothetical protein